MLHGNGLIFFSKTEMFLFIVFVNFLMEYFSFHVSEWIQVEISMEKLCSLKKWKNVGQILGVSDFSLRNLHLSIICFIDLKIQNMFLLNLQQLGDNLAIIHQILFTYFLFFFHSWFSLAAFAFMVHLLFSKFMHFVFSQILILRVFYVLPLGILNWLLLRMCFLIEAY